MEEFFAWMDRIRTLDGPEPTQVDAFSVRFHRAAVPGPLDFDQACVRMVDANRQVEVFGDLPASLSILCWADLSSAGSNIVRDQSIASQLGALLTLALNRRIRVASGEMTVSMEGSDTRHFLPSQANDRELLGPPPSDPVKRIEATLQRVLGLSAEDRLVIGSAIELHYAAALLHDLDLNAAYALTVAAIETLSRRYGDPATEWSDWDQSSRFDKLFSRIELSNEQSSELRNSILADKHLSPDRARLIG